MAGMKAYLIGAGGMLVAVSAAAGILFGIFHWSMPAPPGSAASLGEDPAWGPKSAKVVIVEFSEFQCSFCKNFADETLPLIRSTYDNQVRFVFRDFPIRQSHPQAQKASEAAQCAFEQGKFWEYHDILFQNPGALDISSLKSYAAALHLNQKVFDLCLDSGKYADEVQEDFNDGLSQGVSGVPTFFINGRKVGGTQPFSVFKQTIDEELAKASAK